MQNTISYVKKAPGEPDETHIFKYEVDVEESYIVESIVKLIAENKLNCFDAAHIRRDMVQAQKKQRAMHWAKANG